MNVAYKARSDSALAAKAERELLGDLESRDLRPRALYVFKDQSTYDALRSRPSSSEIMLKQVDDLYVAGRVRVDE